MAEPNRGLAFKIVLAVVLAGSMVVLFVVLTRANDSGRKAIESYLESIKGGATVNTSVAGSEADALTNALRETTSFSVSNFQSQHDTSCFWVTLHRSKGDLAARFVLQEHGSKNEVAAASLARECECPEDFEKPCRLQ